MEDDALVFVRRYRRDWRTAAYRLADIVGLHLRDHDPIDYVVTPEYLIHRRILRDL